MTQQQAIKDRIAQHVRGKTPVSVQEQMLLLLDHMTETDCLHHGAVQSFLKPILDGTDFAIACVMTCAAIDISEGAAVAIHSVHLTPEDMLHHVELIRTFRDRYAHLINLARDAQETPEALSADALKAIREWALAYVTKYLCSDLHDTQEMLVDNRRLITINGHPCPFYVTDRKTTLTVSEAMAWTAEPLNLPEAGNRDDANEEAGE